jgi:hypothetical protein
MNRLTRVSILILLNLILAPKLFSQEIKTYKGSYKGGEAEYQYYENAEMERVLNGKFKYKFEKYAVGGSMVFTEIGTFTNNIKNGEWSFEKGFIDNIGSKYYKLLLIQGSFINDLRNGEWKISSYKVKEYSGTKASFELDPAKSFSQSFISDTLVNKKRTGSRLKCEIDSKGNLIGDWQYHDTPSDTEITATFKENILIKFLHRKISTGEIKAKYLPNFDLVNFNECVKKYNRAQFGNNVSSINIGGNPPYDINKDNSHYFIDESLTYLLNKFSEYPTYIFNEQGFEYIGNFVVQKKPYLLMLK